MPPSWEMYELEADINPTMISLTGGVFDLDWMPWSLLFSLDDVSPSLPAFLFSFVFLLVDSKWVQLRNFLFSPSRTNSFAGPTTIETQEREERKRRKEGGKKSKEGKVPDWLACFEREEEGEELDGWKSRNRSILLRWGIQKGSVMWSQDISKVKSSH